MKKSLFVLIGTLGLIAIITAVCFTSNKNNLPTYSPGSVPDDTIFGLFIVDGEVYYTNHGNQLFRYDSNEVIYEFPSRITYFPKMSGFIYNENGKFNVFDLKTKQSTSLGIEGDYIQNILEDYVIYTQNYTTDREYFAWDISEKTSKKIDMDVINIHTLDSNSVLIEGDNSKLTVYDISTDTVLNTFYATIFHPNIIGDKLYHSRRDGKLHSYSLKDETHEKYQNVPERIIAMEYTNDDLLCITEIEKDNKNMVSLGKFDESGNYTIIAEYHEIDFAPLHICRFVTDGNIYAYAANGGRNIFTGTL